MPLNKSKGNMYNWCSHTYNVVKGECPHGCSYCYCKRWGKQSSLHFDEKELETDLGSGNFIFVGSSCDMFAKTIPREWIDRVLDHCKMFAHNEYLFQSKNPDLRGLHLPVGSIIGTTIETNRYLPEIMGKAPLPFARMAVLLKYRNKYPTMVSLEPIIDFDAELASWIKAIKPVFVSIGADSKGHGLPEPPPDKLQSLIDSLRQFTEVKVKSNLKRLLG